eukprot:CAMPEP_0119474444 /NCGR_PEP_ID=MMETSP1344-20130328/5696_1 /TAXON_ID=236787 /ORGANISM="Florenciella parvula, Strain CCMP2471" /LENGTH=69 /DNA_ID=CAMNT_0007507741 /DNA_START=550 /DNA_END=755 /DNA_ORIENTATION=-
MAMISPWLIFAASCPSTLKTRSPIRQPAKNAVDDWYTLTTRLPCCACSNDMPATCHSSNASAASPASLS